MFRLSKRNPNKKSLRPSSVVDKDRARSRTVDARIQQSIGFEYLNISSQKQVAPTSIANAGPFLILVAADTVHEIKKSPQK